MGQGYLIDSNAIIDFFNYALPEAGIDLLLSVDPCISIITQIEIFSKHDLEEREIGKLLQFTDNATIYLVDKTVALQTVKIRLKNKIKLPDAIIAATAICYNLTLVTRNIADFNNIEGPSTINPHTI